MGIYPLVKLSKDKQKKFFNVCIIIICVLIAIYFVLSAAELQLNSYIIQVNTEAVAGDDTKVEVEYINEDGTLYLYDTTSVPDEKVTSYIRTAQGSGVYYIPEGQMVAEITRDEALDLGMRFMILDVAVLLIVVCLLVWKKGSKKVSILLAVGYGIATAIIDIVMKYYCVNTLVTAFPIQWVVCGRYLVFLVLIVILYRKYKLSNGHKENRNVK